MEWQDEAIILGARRHGERDVIAVVLSFEHGCHAGLVRGGTGSRQRHLLQTGNVVEAVWKARLAQHLGAFTFEIIAQPAAALLDQPLALAGLASACAVVEAGVGERDPHPLLYAALKRLLERVGRQPHWLADYVRFEVLLLQEAGFGIDLSACAVTGVTEGLAYVSPRTGRAVTAEAAGEHTPKLLALPPFLVEPVEPDAGQIAQGLKLAGYFLNRHIAEPNDRPLPLARERLLALLAGPAAEHPQG